MAESIRGGLSLGLASYPFWSVDIGGFEGSPSPGIYKRWLAWGLLCSHSRLHGSGSYRVPWAIEADSKNGGTDGEEGATAVLRKFVKLKARLMPYLLAQAVQSVKKGWPVSLRAMFLEFPEDPTSWWLERQFMVGESLLCAPVFSEEEVGEATFYLPKGRWTSWWDDSVVEGGGWRTEKHGFETCPLYVREGSLLVLGKVGEKRTVYEYGEDAVVKGYCLGEGSKATLVDKEGKEVGEIKAVRDGKAAKGWKVEGSGARGLKGGWKLEVVG
jgi:alpha-D-xyloside xylohydrolase